MSYNDTCIRLQDSSQPLWLSPNILLNSTTAPYLAELAHNTVKVNVHLDAAAMCKNIDPTDLVRVELYVSPLNAAPASKSQSKQIGLGYLNGAQMNNLIMMGQEMELFNWDNLDPTSPFTQPGHHCLYARAYPDSEPNVSATFDVNDQHEAQHNICIVTCNSPCGQEVLLWTVQEEVEVMTLLTIAELKPDEAMMVVLRQIVAHVPEIEGIRFEPPPRFMVHPGDGEVLGYRNNNEPGPDGTFGGHPFPNIEIDFALQPGKPIAVRFATDLEQVEPGQAHVFHLTHLDRERRVQGGLTLFAMRQGKA